MAVIGVTDVEAAAKAGRGELMVAARDRVTPLAHDRARELGIRLLVTAPAVPAGPPAPARSSAPPSAPTGPALTGPALTGPAAAQPGPPSGALFRRGAPVPPGVAAPGLKGERSAVARNAGRAAPEPTAHGRVGRVVVVGAGHVGMITAMRLAEADVVDEVVLTDLVEGLAAGIALDLAHTAPLAGFSTRLRGVGTVEEAGPADYYVVTAGRPRSPGMSRTDLVSTNAAIVDDVARRIARTSPAAVVVVVTNPLDEMTHQAWLSSGFPPERVLGMAGVLDTARFEALLALRTGADPRRVEAVALGSHGDEMVLPLSLAAVDGAPAATRAPGPVLEAVVERARGSGAEIVGLLGKGSAFFAPGTSAARMVLAMIADDGQVLPAAVLADGAYGLRDVYLGLPARLGRGGVREIVELPLAPAERAALAEAAERVRARVDALVGGAAPAQQAAR